MTRVLWGIGIGLAIIVCSGAAARGQSGAASHFHEAAQQYVAGNRAAAQRAVEQGLEVAPSDPRLNALREKLKQQGEQPSGQQDSSATSSDNRSQQNSESSSSETAEEGDDSSPSSGNQGSGQSSAQSGNQNQSTASSSQSEQQSGSFTPTDSSAQPNQRRQGGGAPRDTLSREQAERLLRALEGQERKLLRELRTRSANPRSVEKDW